MRLLVVSPVIPFPPAGGGHLRAYHFLRALAARHDVTLVGFTYGENPSPPPFPVRVEGVLWEWPPLYWDMLYGDPEASRSAFETLSVHSPAPFFVSYFESKSMSERLRRVAQEGFDVAVVVTTQMGRFLDDLTPHLPKVLDFWNVETLAMQRDAGPSPDGGDGGENQEAEKMLRFERAIAAQCASCLVVSEPEASAARTMLGAHHLQVVPNGVDTTYFTPAERETPNDSLLFVGTMNYAPNVAAVRYFVHSVLPLVREDVPQAKLHVVGTNPANEVKDLAAEEVVIHGFVPDVRPFYRDAAVVVAPLLHGGGTRLKILEAAASGKAIVSTSRGTEGLQFRVGEDIVVADSAPAFAQAVVDLLRDAPRRRALGRRARDVARQHDWEPIGRQVCRIVEDVAERAHPATRQSDRVKSPTGAIAADGI